jgi:hypothetical protein
MQTLKTKLHYSTAYHPQTDGQTERTNRTLEDILRSLCTEQSKWDTLLPTVQFALNTSVSDTTKHSPFELNHGFKPKVPAAYYSQLQPKDAPKNNAALDVIAKIKDLNTLIKSKIATAQLKQQHYAKRTPMEFEEGDMVSLSTAHLPIQGSLKLSHRYYGPFKIVQKISRSAYRLKLPPQWRVHDVFNISQLKPYHAPADGRAPVPIPPVIGDDGEEQYEVDRIVAHRRTRKNKVLEFLVMWKGYPLHEAEWLTQAHLESDGLALTPLRDYMLLQNL